MTDILLACIGGDSHAEILALLKHVGCNVALTGETEEITSLATGSTWDLIVLDVGVPDQRCLEICQAIKEVTTTIPLIILSAAGSSDESLIRGLSAGADEFIVKPVTAAVLVARINALLRRARWSQQQEEAVMGQMTDRVDWAELEGLSQEEIIMLTCSYTLQEKGQQHAPPYELFQIPGGAYVVKTSKRPGDKHITLILTD